MSAKFRFVCLKASLVAVFLLFLQGAFSQRKKPEESKMPVLDEAITRTQNALGTDFSVMVLSADSTLYQKTIGDVTNIKTPSPIGASSQWLTTALLLQLADEGKLSLDDPVAKYLPVFELYRRNYVTIRHCLTHQTGLGTEGFRLLSLFEKTKFSSLEEAVTDLLKKEIHANAGEQFRYSNYGFIVAARVAEVVGKKKFDQLIRTKLFVPMGLHNTSFTTDDGSAPNPSGGAKSTVADYGKFLQMLLNGGKVGEKQILSAAAVEEMRKVSLSLPQIKGTPKADEGFAFTLGAWDAEGSNVAGEKTNSVVLPGLTGVWPEVDFSHRYAFLVFARKFSGEQRKDAYMQLKDVIDGQVGKVGSRQ